MKKYLIGLSLLAVGVFLGSSTHAQTNNCQTVQFPEGSVCVWIERVSSGEYRVRRTVSSNQSTISLRCDIEYGNNPVFRQSVGTCDGTFFYASNNTESVSIDIWLGSNTAKRITGQYNFWNGTWASSWNNNPQWNNNWSNALYDLDVYVNTISPSVNQSINVNIMALQNVGSILNNYNGTVQFSVQQWINNNWQNVSSNNVFLNRSSYTFGWNDGGQVTLNNLIEFRASGTYRLSVRDVNSNITRFIQFTVGGSNNRNDQNNWNNQNLANFNLTTNRPNPTINQRTNLTIQARNWNNSTINNYNGTVSFTVDYRVNTNQNWQSASWSLYTLDRTSYSFTRNNNGTVTLNDLIRFTTNGRYRLTVRDATNNVSSSIEFNVGGSSNNRFGTIHNFGLTTNRTNPTTNQRANVTIQARDNANNIVQSYNRTVNFSVQSRANNTSNRQNASTSSYTLDRTSYTFVATNNGQVTLNNLIRFNNNGQYRLVVQDSWNNIIGYLNFNVGSTSRSNTPGFTTTQINQIQGLYSIRPSFISQMETRYPRLRTNNTWRARQAALYQQMDAILRGQTSIYNNYDAFFNDFRDRYVYTLQVR